MSTIVNSVELGEVSTVEANGSTPKLTNSSSWFFITEPTVLGARATALAKAA